MTLMLIVIGLIFAAAAVFAIIGSHNGRDTDSGMLVIIPLKKGMENAELLLRQAMYLRESGRIILLDMGADGDTPEICRRFSESGISFELISWEDKSSEIIKNIILDN